MKPLSLLKFRFRILKKAMDICLFGMLCVGRKRSMRLADPSSREVLPAVVCHCVCSKNVKIEAALARVGLLRQRKGGKTDLSISIYRLGCRRKLISLTLSRIYSIRNVDNFIFSSKAMQSWHLSVWNCAEINRRKRLVVGYIQYAMNYQQHKGE
jgi:hypothetical protein